MQFAFGQSINFSIKSSNTNPYEGCENGFIEFVAIIPGSSSVDSVVLVDSTKANYYIRHNEWSVTGRKYSFTVILKAGTYNPILRVKRGGTSTWEEVVLPKRIKIYDNPVASFELTSDTTQCFEGNEYSFKNTSTLSSHNHAITQIVMDYGSGEIGRSIPIASTSYPAGGTFDVLMVVLDEKGCRDEIVAKKIINVLKPVGADFRAIGAVGCPKTEITFTNRSSVATSDVTGWAWHWEPGVADSFTASQIATDWATIKRTYNGGTKYYSPKLVVHTSYGCSDSLQIIDAVRTVSQNMDFTMRNTGPMCAGDTAHFILKDTGSFNQILWSFGDPTSGTENTNRVEANPSHQFKTPGSYPISLSILRSPCPILDTTICCVQVNGPMAKISLESPNLQNEVYLKPELELMNADPDYKFSTTKIDYYERTPGKSYVGGLMNEFEKERLFSGNLGAKVIGKYRIALPVLDSVFHIYRDSLDYIVTKKTWIRGTAIPKGVMYVSPISTDPLVHKVLHDTLKLADANLDSLVIDFPNFSTKRRIKASFADATYDIPAYFDDYPYINGYHPKFNPSYPYASDSLEFFWDFDDPAALSCTSTVANPNPYCQYSTEKLPRHIFTENGCFQVALTAIDPVVGCSNTEYETITYEAPKAGYDESAYQGMTWEKQNRLLAQNTPLEGMGIRLEGNGCLSSAASPNFFDILIDGIKPSCNDDDLNAPLKISFLGDAENDCNKKVYIRDNNGKITDSTYRDCAWIPGITLKLIGNKWAYSTPGWKTVGIVAEGGNFSRDTFFYKDYIYMSDVNAEFVVRTQGLLDSVTQLRSIRARVLNQNSRTLDSITAIHYRLDKTATINGESISQKLREDSLETQIDGLVDLTDTVDYKLSPGKYVITSSGQNKRGCNGGQVKEVIVGHLANFRVQKACSGLPTTFIDSVYYWDKRGASYCDIINWWANTTCIDTSDFFKNPTKTRDYWVKNVAGYQLPKFKEQIAWDYDSDGTIDDVNPSNPSFTYSKPGDYTCTMWSMDSTGQWIKNTKTFTIAGIVLSASLEAGQSKYLCTPTQRTINYEAKVFGDSSFRVSTPNTTFLNQSKGSFIQAFLNNTPYALVLTGSTSSGCVDTLIDSNFLSFISPKASFSTQTDSICPGKNLVATNTGSTTGRYAWTILHNNITTTRTTRDLNEKLSGEGIFELTLTTTEEVTDPETNKKVTCVSTFPEASAHRIYNVESIDIDFDLSDRLADEKVEFEITNFDSSYRYAYRINGRRRTISKNRNFVAQFPGRGDYTICLYATVFGCEDSTCLNTWVDHVGMDERSMETLNIFPNPAQNLITVQGIETGSTYELSNLLGETFAQGRANAEQITIPVQALSNGIYLLTLKQSGIHSTQKVVIKR